MWITGFIFAILFLVLAAGGAIISGRVFRSGKAPRSINILMVGAFLSALSLMLPIYIKTMKVNGCGYIEAIFVSLYDMIKLFLMDGEFDPVTDVAGYLPAWLYSAYSALFSVLMVLAPVLTFGFVLSFFKNVSAYQKLLFNYCNPVYVFSELNDKALALAESIHQRGERCALVFTDVFETDDEKSYELVERAKGMGAICFKKDIVTIHFNLHSQKSTTCFFALGEDQAENLTQALKLIDLYARRENVHLYVCSTQPAAELMMGNVNAGKIRVRRVNEVQSLIYRNLYENGFRIFESADEGVINAVVVGMGHHGTEMTKALAWFTQMDGYRPYIHAFDRDPQAESRFRALCPELLEKRGNFTDDGEAIYDLQIHSGLDVETQEFKEAIAGLGNVTYVLLALGQDELNIKTAVQLRTLFEQIGIKPIIQAIVYNSEKSAALAGVANHSNQKYEIDFIGDLESTYSYKVILDSELEEAGMARHRMWGDEEDFWRHEYNYRSSVASALHHQMKVNCKIPGIELPPAERRQADREAIRRMEHRRWNAYMRAEGYIYQPVRNNLAKAHPCLVCFDALPQKEKEKDDD